MPPRGRIYPVSLGTANPAKGVENLPRKTARRHVYLSADDVHRLADESGQHRALVLVLAYCGVRWGEAVALRVRDVEFLRRRLSVSENAVQLSVNHAVGPTKGRKARSVPVPAFVLDELSAQCKGKASSDLVFPGRDRGYLQRPKSSTGWFQAAVKKAKVQKITPHDLRHTCASLAVSAGVNVLALQRMLGHKSAKVTLDTYADLFDDDLDAVAVSLHARYSTAHNCDSPKLLASCGQNAATGRSQGVAHVKMTVYLRRCPHRVSAGGGTRTLTLSRARAPKARVSANSTTPASPTSVPLTSLTNLSVAPPTVDLLTAAKGLRNAIREGVRSRTGADSVRCKRLRDRASNRVAAKDS